MCIKRIIYLILTISSYITAQTNNNDLSLDSFLSNPLGLSKSDDSYVLKDFTKEFGIPERVESIEILTYSGFVPGQRLYWGSLIADISTGSHDSGTIYYFQLLDSSINLGNDIKVNISIGAPFDSLHESLLNKLNFRFVLTDDKITIDDHNFSIVISSENGTINSISWNYWPY